MQEGLIGGIAALSACALTAILGYFLLPILKKLHFGQTILDIGPSWHKSKQGTPTMGGIAIILGTVGAVLLAAILILIKSPELLTKDANLQKIRLWGGLLMSIFFGAIGFIDDYIKVVKKRNLGLTAWQKLILQILTSFVYAFSCYLSGDNGMFIPFVGNVKFGLWYVPVMVFLIVGFVNAVNLTDGIDGLASSVTFIVALCFMFISGVVLNSIPVIGINILSAALAGSCLGFLFWNFHPAKMFMGDTGSLFMGGMVCAIAFGLNIPIILLLAGIVYVMEAGSVILQVTYFKLTHGKRLFKMSPIHHHFEKCGLSEIAIVTLFSIIAFVGCIISAIIVKYGVM